MVRYGEEGPGQVGHQQLGVAAEMVTWAFSERTRREWQRPLIYSSPEPIERDLAWLAQHTVHEGEHHLFDVDRILTQRVRYP